MGNRNGSDYSKSYHIIQDYDLKIFKCIESNYMDIRTAASPVFDLGKDFYENLNTFYKFDQNFTKNYNISEFPTFTESLWDKNSFQMEIFFKSKDSRDGFKFVFGLIFFIIVYYTNYWITCKSSVIFV